jgi:hypothetical protein|tara:strand:- start:6077 stop:6460 length:384 start_codon:yes stop_codon:yes gene_type:complete
MKHELTWEYENKEYILSLDLTDKPTITSYSIIGEVKPKEIIKEQPKPKKSSGCYNCNASKLKRFIDGGVGLLKVELGVDATDEATIIDRRNICESCEHYDFGVCNKCGCFCSAKVKLKSETCPDKRW